MRVSTLAGIPLALAAAAATLGYLGPVRSAPEAGPAPPGGALTTAVFDAATARPGDGLTTPASDLAALRFHGALSSPIGISRAGGRWCALSITGGPDQVAPGAADRDSRYERADPRRVERQPTDPCRPASAA